MVTPKAIPKPLQALAPTPNVIKAQTKADNLFCSGADLPPLTLQFEPGARPPAGFDWNTLRDWELSVMLLEFRDRDYGEHYSIENIAQALTTGNPRSLYYHTKILWPDWNGRLQFHLQGAVRLIRYYHSNGVTRLPRATMIARLQGAAP